MKLSFKLEHTDRPDIYRGIVFNTLEHGYRPVTVIHDIGEGPLADINFWLTDTYPGVQFVRLSDGTLDEPDCLTVFEAAEASMEPAE